MAKNSSLESQHRIGRKQVKPLLLPRGWLASAAFSLPTRIAANTCSQTYPLETPEPMLGSAETSSLAERPTEQGCCSDITRSFPAARALVVPSTHANAFQYFPNAHRALITAVASYLQSFDLPQASTSRSPQPPTTQKMAAPIRGPSKTVMSALENPYLPGSDWECIPRQSKAGPETIGSQTTVSNADAAAFNNTVGQAEGGLIETNVEALKALGSDSASNAHKADDFATSNDVEVTSNADKVAPSQQPEDKHPGSSGSKACDAINLSYVGSWAKDQ
ncbi:hypothetical protein MKX08_004593 [Trichoderma sp. CBMAI-0020]|nr:hypothetical protein MKX08_004593 [Trichoderma sp. CBMAI-0020]